MVLYLLALLLFAHQALGLKCWTCENAISNAACNQDGDLRLCKDNEVQCVVEVRTVNGLGKRVTKQCKQRSACLSDQKQNVGTMARPQCNGVGYQSVCRCCCDTDNCNGRSFQCGLEEMCEKPQNIQNGMIVCPRRVTFGTTCRLRCNRGYHPNKVLPLRCISGSGLKLGTFTNLKGLRCVKKISRCGVMQPPKGGTMKCVNAPPRVKYKMKNFEGSVCTFSCPRNTYPARSSKTTCVRGLWDHKSSRCVSGRCPIPPKHANMISKCTSGYKFGSTCRYSCTPGYTISGKSVATCVQSRRIPQRGYWTNNISPCQRVICPILVSPRNARLLCTNGNFDGSLCIFSCDQGYYMEGSQPQSIETTCQLGQNGLGEWSKKLPKCNPITCPKISRRLEHGAVVCSKDNRWGSSCTYKCNYGYDLDGTISSAYRIFCKESRRKYSVGEWSSSAPKCLPVRCFTPRRAPLNGYVICTNENYARSVCTFRCKRGFDLSNTNKTKITNKCIDERFGMPRGEWDNLPGICRRRIYCKKEQRAIPNGKVICSQRNFAGSSCRFTCNEGYELVGNRYLFCSELKEDGDHIAEWSNPTPKCVPKHCAKLWYDKGHVKETCRYRYKQVKSSSVVGTACRYSCHKNGYYSITNSGRIVKTGSVLCKCLPTLEWSGTPPRCFIKTCPHLHTPQNSYEPVCSKKHNFGSSCQFRCKFGFRLSHSMPLLCINGQRGSSEGKWSRQPPTCIPVK